MKISVKIILLFLLVFVLFAGSASYFVFYNLRSALEKEIGKQQLIVSKQLMEEIDIFLYERLQNIKTVGQAPPVIQALVSKDTASLAKANKKLKEFFSSTGPWDNLIILNAKGDVIISSYDIEAKDISKRPGIFAAYKEAIKGQVYYSDATLSLATNRPTIFFGYPMKNTDAVGSPIVGAAVGELAWPAVIEYLQKIKKPTAAYLFNKSGQLIGDSSFESSDKDFLNPNFINNQIVQHALSSQDMSMVIPGNKNDPSYLLSHVLEQGHLNYKGNDWILVAEIPTDVAFIAAIDSALAAAGWAAAFVIIFLSFLFIVIQRFFIIPVSEVSSAMEKRTQGDLKLRLKVKTKDEIGQMSIAFNQMADTLNDFYKNLEQKVKDRTKDLEDARMASQNVLEDLENEKEALARANAKDEALLESIGEGVVAVDSGGKIILMNNAAEKMLGLDADEVIGKPIVNAWKMLDENENPIPESNRPIAVILKGKTVNANIGSYYYVRKNGTKFPVAITVTSVVSDGKTIGAIVVFRDITKEKEAEKLRTDFLSLASHQLRTPLSGVKWLIETVQRGVLGKMNKKQGEYLNKIYVTNERMIKLVSDMLNVLRLENGGEFIKKEKVPISKIFKELAVTTEAAALSRWVAIRNVFKNDKLTEVQTDEKMLESILDCFVSNAINYSKPGQEVVLDVCKKGAEIVFSVKDSGIGIPKEEQVKIFGRFYRASNAKEFKPGGTGLGLYVAQMLAEKIGGKVSFKSKEGKGSTFYVKIPVASSKEVAIKEQKL